MKRQTRKRRQQRKSKPKPPTKQLEELLAVLEHAQERGLDQADRRKLSQAIRAACVVQEALANGASIPQLRRLLRETLSDDAEPDRGAQSSSDAAPVANHTEDDEVQA